MRLYDVYAGGRFGLSFEVYPPKSPEGDAALSIVIRELAAWRPAFISCTYGAGGSTAKQTIKWCKFIQELDLVATAHFTCVGATRQELLAWLKSAKDEGIRNIMALRGDPPQGQDHFQTTLDGLSYASELVTLIRDHFPDLGIGVAGYPEKHPESLDLATDLSHQVHKIRAGANAVFTQMFFDNQRFFEFRNELWRQGVTVPIVPGIMPITDYARIARISSMCGAAIPSELNSRLEAASSDKAAQFEIGVRFAIDQCRDLLKQGIPGIHFYVLNKSQACDRILQRLDLPQ